MNERRLTAKQLAVPFNTSRSTISRWVDRGCPVNIIPGYCRRQIFDLSAVKAWLRRESAAAGETHRPSCRYRLKEYYVFSVDGDYLETITGSRQLIDRLKGLPVCDRHRPYAMDNAGYIYFLYSGKLRKHDTVRSELIAVWITSRHPQNLEHIHEIARKWYLR